MSGYGLIDYNTLNNIANAIRAKTNYPGSYYPYEMPSAINGIKAGGGGFSEAVITSMTRFRRSNEYGGYNNSLVNFQNMVAFDITNNIPYDAPGFQILSKEYYPEICPAEVTLFMHYGNLNTLFVENGTFIGFCSDSLYGDYCQNNPININGVPVPVKIGDVVSSGPSGTYMFRWDGTNWINLHFNRQAIHSDVYSVNNNIYGVISGGPIYGIGVNSDYNADDLSVLDMTMAFSGCLNRFQMPKAICGKYTRYMSYAYYNCSSYNIHMEPVCGPYVINMHHAYDNCMVYFNAACGNNVTDFSYAYNNCINLVGGTIGSKVENMTNAYYNCSNIKTITGNPINVVEAANAFINCNNLYSYPLNWPNLINAYNMFYNANNIQSFINAPNLVNGAFMYRDIRHFSHESAQEYINSLSNVKDISGMFSYGDTENGVNLLNLQIPEWVESIAYMYVGNHFYNVWTQVDVENNIWMNIPTPRINNTPAYIPDTVKNIDYAYSHVNGIISADCGNNVIYMNNTYEECITINSEPKVGPNVKYMRNTYYRCYNLTGNAACSDSVLTMDNAYIYCHNILNAACGNNVIDMNSTYRGCQNLLSAACGPNVKYMDCTYCDCYNLTGNAACGDNVTLLYNTYKNCQNLTRAACGNNVVNMQYAYDNCTNLTGKGESGPNVQYMSYAYRNCYMLTDGEIGPNVVSAEEAFCNCYNLVNAVLDGNFRHTGSTSDSAYYTFSNCINLRSATIGNRVLAMIGTFQNCRCLENISIPENAIYLSYSFRNCVNLSCDVVFGDNAQYIAGVLENCNNVQNIYFNGQNLIYYSQYYLQNAFNRSNYSLRRNVVIHNYKAWNNFVIAGNKIFGGFIMTKENYETPVEVNVNGIAYNCVRCAYNITYNCYAYCME